MREDRDATATVNQFDRFRDRDATLVEVCGAPRAEIAVEGVAQVHRPSVFDQSPRDVRATDRRIARDRENIVKGDADAESIQELDDSLRAFPSGVNENGERLAHRVELGEVQSKNVDLVGRFVRRQFHTGHEFDSEALGGFTSWWNSFHRVVVGECERLKPGVSGREDNDLRGVRSIGRRRMEVEVDVPRGTAWRGSAGHGE
jgi:hypothetical protein